MNGTSGTVIARPTGSELLAWQMYARTLEKLDEARQELYKAQRKQRKQHEHDETDR